MKRSSLSYVDDLPLRGFTVLDWITQWWDSEAAIAGGAVRECLLGRPELIKDVDIWCSIETGLTGLPGEPTETEAVLNSLTRYLAGLGLLWRHVVTLEADNPDITWIIKIVVEGVDIDILNTTRKNGKDCRELLESFDYGLCMCAATLDTVWTHELFHHDVAHMTCTYHATNREQPAIRRSVEDHLPRITAKYPNFTPAELPDLEEGVGLDISWVRVKGCDWIGDY